MIRPFVFGAAFGFLLTRAGATRYDVIAKMFLFEDFHLAIVMAVAIGVAAVGIHLLGGKRWATGAGGACPLAEAKPASSTLVPGALIFGVGWGLTGSCPGTALAGLGEGRLVALFTVLGLFLGTAFYARQQRTA